MISDAPATAAPTPPPSRLTPVVANRAMAAYLVAAPLGQLLVLRLLGVGGIGTALLTGGLLTLLALVSSRRVRCVNCGPRPDSAPRPIC
jgi:hypothetical protein